MQYKLVISIFAIILTFVGYIPYLVDTFQGRTKPHIYSWFIWLCVTFLIFSLQITSGAGVGAWITFSAACILCIILVLSLFQKNPIKIHPKDIITPIIFLIALFFWFVFKQPTVSTLIISFISLIGFIPTLFKSWHEPNSETLSLYQLNALRHGLNLFALERYSVVTWLFPLTWMIANATFSLFLIVRRKEIQKKISR